MGSFHAAGASATGCWTSSSGSFACPACAATPAQSSGLAGCLGLRVAFSGSLTRLVHTRCVHDGRELAAERSHALPVLSISFAGASLVRFGRRTVQADAVNAIWSLAGVEYETRHPWGASCRGCHIAFEHELGSELDSLSRNRESGLRAVVATLGVHLRLRRLVRALEGAGEQGTTELQLEEELITIARATMAGRPGGGSAARGPEAGERHRRVVARACELIQERYRESLGLANVARCAGASPAHLTRIFRRQTGMSIHQYQTRLRLAAALDSVLEPGVDLSALAHELGFASHSHLTASFRSAFGCTPSELRREVRGNRRRALGSSRARAITSSSPGSRDRG